MLWIAYGKSLQFRELREYAQSENVVVDGWVSRGVKREGPNVSGDEASQCEWY